MLAITILSAAAIPHYVLARRATLLLVELYEQGRLKPKE